MLSVMSMSSENGPLYPPPLHASPSLETSHARCLARVTITIHGKPVCSPVSLGTSWESSADADIRRAKRMRLCESINTTVDVDDEELGSSCTPSFITSVQPSCGKVPRPGLSGCDQDDLDLDVDSCSLVAVNDTPTFCDEDVCEDSLADAPESITDSEDEEIPGIFDSRIIEFIKYVYYLPREALAAVVPPKGLLVPRVTLALDVDETLVHCSTEFIIDADFSFPVTWNGELFKVYGRKRPGLDEFLSYVASRFEVIIFTASQQVYADKLLNILDPTGTIFSHRVFRDSCVNIEGNLVKDLTVLGRDLSSTVILDNSPQAYSRHPDNGIPIASWFDDPNDSALHEAIGFLQEVAQAADVRHLVREKFQLSLLAGLLPSVEQN